MKTNPTTANVSLWLNHMSREQLHEQGWIEVNRRFHGIARAARPFLQEYFPDEQDQEAAFDGLTLALLAVGHFEDIERISSLLTETNLATKSAVQSDDKADEPKQTKAK